MVLIWHHCTGTMLYNNRISNSLFFKVRPFQIIFSFYHSIQCFASSTDMYQSKTLLSTWTEQQKAFGPTLQKTQVLVNPTVLEIFYQDSYRTGNLVNLTVVKIFNPLRRPRGFRQCRAPSWFFNFCNLFKENINSKSAEGE